LEGAVAGEDLAGLGGYMGVGAERRVVPVGDRVTELTGAGVGTGVTVDERDADRTAGAVRPQMNLAAGPGRR
jgi:hypothetical protein